MTAQTHLMKDVTKGTLLLPNRLTCAHVSFDNCTLELGNNRFSIHDQCCGAAASGMLVGLFYQNGCINKIKIWSNLGGSEAGLKQSHMPATRVPLKVLVL